MSRVSQASGSILPPLGSLVAPRKGPGLADGNGEQGEAPDTGSSSLMNLARPFQKAEALLRQCVNPGLWRQLPFQAGPGSYDSEEEDSPGGLARLAQVEGSFSGLRRCLRVQENPRSETFRGLVRPSSPEAARGAFSHHPARASVARQCATLHALLQHRHHLRLARHYGRRLKAASDFVSHLRAARRCLLLPAGRRNPSWPRLLRGLCEEMRAHAAHWEGLRQHIRRDPWLRPLLLQRPEAVQRMKRALSLLALHAARLLEGCLEAFLRAVTYPAAPGPLSDLFQGLEIYNQVLGDQALQQAFLELGETNPGVRKVPSGTQGTFPIERVLGILASERGQWAGQKLLRLLLQQPPLATGPAWEGHPEYWLGEEEACQRGPKVGEGPSSLPEELQALCQREEEALLPVLRELVSSAQSLRHHVLQRPKQEKPLPFLEEPPEASATLPGWKSVRWLDASFAEAAGGLYAELRPLLWKVAASTLEHRLQLHWPMARWQEGAGAALGQQLNWALAQAQLPRESAEELSTLALHLLLQDVRQHWDQAFCHALGSSLTDKCMAKPAIPGANAAHSQTAQRLQSLYLPLNFTLGCLDSSFARSAAEGLLPAGLRLELLSLSTATTHASCFWVMSKAYQYLASWSLGQFLLVTQGDLQLLKEEAKETSALVCQAFAEGRRTQRPLLAGQEQELAQQVHSTAASIEHFSHNVLRLFSLDCKRMSAEIFTQTMPLGKHWRLALRTELPTSPSEYASAAAQTVLGQVLQGIQLLPHEAQGPALGQVTTAFLEAWMDHILAQKIKFSLQGALQLKQDFDLVRELLQSQDYGLSPEIRQRVLSQRVFQQTDNAIACLLQQPSKAPLPSHTWAAFHKCCSSDGIRTQDGGPGSLNSLQSLEGLPAARPGAALETPAEAVAGAAGDLLSRMQGPGCSPETYLSSTQQEWLALRLHGGRRWRVPALPCMNRTSEP